MISWGYRHTVQFFLVKSSVLSVESGLCSSIFIIGASLSGISVYLCAIALPLAERLSAVLPLGGTAVTNRLGDILISYRLL